MTLHRAIRLVCVLGAAIALPLSANLARVAAKTAMRNYLKSSGDSLPLLTQTWVRDLASGQFQLILISLPIAAAVLILGLWLLYSRRFSTEAASSALTVLCCVGYTIALPFTSVVLFAITLAFVPQGRE